MGIRCLGIDPGLGRLGYGLIVEEGSSLIVEESGCIETSPRQSIPERLLVLGSSLREVFQSCAPDLLAVEKLFFGRNTTTAEMVWQARGVVLLFGAERQIPIVEPKPSEVKLAVSGYGNADKTQLQRMVCRLLGLTEIPRPDDIADALAVACTGVTMHRTPR